MQSRQAGLVSPLLVTSIVLGLLVLGLAGFSFWAYSEYQSYKNDVDPKIAAAVKTAKEEQVAADKARFDEEEKLPNRTLVGPIDLGQVTVSYPKTWSAYVEKNGEGGHYEAYLHPGEVPGVALRTAFALRLTMEDKTYESAVNDFRGLVQSGKLKSSVAKVGDAEGVRLDGTFANDIKGSMVLFKVRDKTLKVYTQSDTYVADFNNTILPSLKFNK